MGLVAIRKLLGTSAKNETRRKRWRGNPDEAAGGTMPPKEVLQLAKKHDVKFVDLKFIDLPGVWQHTTIPATRLDEGLFEEGLAFDGSSIRGWQPINASDMVMVPDPETAKIDPFYSIPTLSLTCSIFDPITKQ